MKTSLRLSSSTFLFILAVLAAGVGLSSAQQCVNSNTGLPYACSNVEYCCGGRCDPNKVSCGDGTCCNDGGVCCVNGCCTTGETCCGDSTCCKAGSTCCPSKSCAPAGYQCCDASGSCPAGGTCNVAGVCSKPPTSPPTPTPTATPSSSTRPPTPPSPVPKISPLPSGTPSPQAPPPAPSPSTPNATAQAQSTVSGRTLAIATAAITQNATLGAAFLADDFTAFVANSSGPLTLNNDTTILNFVNNTNRVAVANNPLANISSPVVKLFILVDSTNALVTAQIPALQQFVTILWTFLNHTSLSDTPNWYAKMVAFTPAPISTL